MRPALDTVEAAAVIGCAPTTLRQSRVTGRLGDRPAPLFRKMGRRVIYDADIIAQWIADAPQHRNVFEVAVG